MRTTKYDARTAASISALAKRIMQDMSEGLQPLNPDQPGFRPMQITFPPKPKYQFSRSKWYAAEYDWIDYGEAMAWCAEQFGPHPRQHDAWSRWWDRYEGKVYFRDERDYQWFVLRWGA